MQHEKWLSSRAGNTLPNTPFQRGENPRRRDPRVHVFLDFPSYRGHSPHQHNNTFKSNRRFSPRLLCELGMGFRSRGDSMYSVKWRPIWCSKGAVEATPTRCGHPIVYEPMHLGTPRQKQNNFPMQGGTSSFKCKTCLGRAPECPNQILTICDMDPITPTPG